MDYDMRSQHAAEYLGMRETGDHYFIYSLGQTNWKTFREDVRRHLKIIASKQKYVFKIRPAASNP
jgi:histidinol phosphatase-like PHP family hydrolase